MTEQNNNPQIAVAGVWNIAIFTELWTKTNILSDYENITIEYPEVALLASLRFITEDFNVSINYGRLEIGYKPNKFNEAIACLRSILQNLIHTPIMMFEINFQFLTTKSEMIHIDTFNFTADIEQHIYSLIETKKQLSYKVAENHTFSICITNNSDSNIFIELNHTYNVKSAKDLLLILSDKDDIADRLHTEALEFLEKKYELYLS